MRKIREVLRLKLGGGLSARQVAGALNISPAAVTDDRLSPRAIHHYTGCYLPAPAQHARYLVSVQQGDLHLASSLKSTPAQMASFNRQWVKACMRTSMVGEEVVSRYFPPEGESMRERWGESMVSSPDGSAMPTLGENPSLHTVKPCMAQARQWLAVEQQNLAAPLCRSPCGHAAGYSRTHHNYVVLPGTS